MILVSCLILIFFLTALAPGLSASAQGTPRRDGIDRDSGGAVLSVSTQKAEQGTEKGINRTAYFFFNNPCASCHEEDEIYEIFHETFPENERASLSVEIQTVNVFEPSERTRMEELLQAAGLDEKDIDLPALLAGNRVLSGYDSIRSGIRELLSDPDWTSPTAEKMANGGQGASTDEAITGDTGSAADRSDGSRKVSAEAAGASSDTDITESAADRSGTERDIGLQTSRHQELSAFRDRLDGIAESAPDAAILFVTEACGDCEKAERLLDGAGIAYSAVSVADPSVYAGYTALMQQLEIPEKSWKVPALYIPSGVTFGAEGIRKNLQNRSITAAAADGAAASLASALADAKAAADGAALTGESGTLPTWYQLLGEGILVGCNPCSLSMLLMLLSVLASAGQSAGRTGVMYLIGKAAAYLGIGVVVFRAYTAVFSGVLGTMRTVLHWILAGLFLILAFFYFADAFHAARMDFGKIRMQLPAGLRRAEHRAIQKIGTVSGALLLPAALILGVLISVGEFFCAGQLYAASIISMAETQAVPDAEVWKAFSVFTLGIMIPSVLLVAAAARMGGAERIAGALARHEAWIKAATGLLFVIFAVLLAFPRH